MNQDLLKQLLVRLEEVEYQQLRERVLRRWLIHPNMSETPRD